MEQFQLQSEPNPDAARPVPLADAFRQNTSHRCMRVCTSRRRSHDSTPAL